jgi:hypothetical protein
VRVRFLADADLSKVIVSGVLRKEPSIDFLTASAAKLGRMTDLEVLALAAAGKRILVSHDVGTMPGHFAAFRKAGKQSSGVFLVPQTAPVRMIIDDLLLVWSVSDASDWENRLTWLPL